VLNEQGIYLVYFWVNGKKTPVTVDDFIPCINGVPFSYNQKASNEVFGLILEKAWAKLHESYGRTEAGMITNALFALTG